jgi:tRNA A-37 threonylcarbamoyl transferase component Bud32
MAGFDLRLRVASADLLSLPWLVPLAEWDATVVPLRDVPVGVSRHLVRFVEADGALWALKEMPLSLAQREYRVLRELERRALPAVRTAGIVVQPFDDSTILVTRYLERSWQYRRLLLRLRSPMHKHRQRLFDAMAALLVDLHRNGIYWGDCSLANTLFKRDGQLLQAWMVDAETSEIHPSLSDGQRATDLEILVENVSGGLLDLAARLDEPDETFDQIVQEADSIRCRYQDVWTVLHEEPSVRLRDRHLIVSRLRRLQDLGFAVEELRLAGGGAGKEELRLQFAVAERGFHTEEIRKRTGLEVGEGQATILLNDLRAHQTRLHHLGVMTDDETATEHWLDQVLRPGMALAHEALHRVGDPIQAYCDLLEVRWLLSERAGHDVGDEPALTALRQRTVPSESAAELSIADVPTQELPLVVIDEDEARTQPHTTSE